MERVAMKRMRSEESDNIYVHQRKVFVNDQIVNANDAAKMSQIHKKTLNILFNAAREKNKMERKTNDIPLWQQIILSGNGTIDFVSTLGTFELKKCKEVSCCPRKAYVQVTCSNCTLAMCENCGHSCRDCFAFICGKCVELFGCGTLEQPICEKCALFN